MLVGKAKSTLRRGMFAKYNKGKMLGVAEKLGERVTLGRQNSLHIGGNHLNPLMFPSINSNGLGLAVPLKIRQSEVTVDDVMKELRESEKTDWCIFKYVTKKELDYVGHGEGEWMSLSKLPPSHSWLGGLDSFVGALEESKLQYGLIKLRHANVDRMVFITFRPETLKPMLKNMVSVHRTIMQEILGKCACRYLLSSAIAITCSQ